MSNYDPVNKPEHYANTKVECIDAMEEVFGIEAVKAVLPVQCVQVPLEARNEERGRRHQEGNVVHG